MFQKNKLPEPKYSAGQKVFHKLGMSAVILDVLETSERDARMGGKYLVRLENMEKQIVFDTELTDEDPNKLQVNY